jgi:hypothetical protein
VVQYIDLIRVVRVCFYQRFVVEILPMRSHCCSIVPSVLYSGSNNAWNSTSRSALIFLEAIPLPLSHFKRLLPRVRTKGKLPLYLIMQHTVKTCG